jgi:hypothetical protein
LVKESVNKFRGRSEFQTEKLTRVYNPKKGELSNSQFFLNIDLESSCRPDFIKIAESKSKFFVFTIFGSIKYIKHLLETHPNLFISVAFPLASESNDPKIMSLLGLNGGKLDDFEESLYKKFDKRVKKLI